MGPLFYQHGTKNRRFFLTKVKQNKKKLFKDIQLIWWKKSQRDICHKFTFGAPSLSSRLSTPAGHLPHQTVLFWDTEELLAARAPWFSSPLAQDRGVVVIRGHLAAGRLVGVAGGAALAQGEGLLCL